MRTFALLALVAAILCLSAGRRTFPNTSPRVGFLNFGTQNSPNSAIKPFHQKNTEYTFIYNAQIASGLQSEENAANPQQKAVTRIQCLAKIQFASERHGQLQLEECQAGQQNEQMSEAQEVQPMELFEQTPIPSQTKLQLHKPCQFTSADGVIERVQCQEDETEWTKNFKKSVLNIIQLNLKRNNAQGLSRNDERQQNTAEEEAWQTKQGKSFTIQEITLEGACQTTYTINRAWSGQQFNVTKTINFKKCQKIADVANGFQTDPPQAQCAQCQQYWAQQQNGQNLRQSDSEMDNAQNGEQNPCAKCDPKEVKEHELDRSTVIRCQIHGEPTNQYTLHSCEMRSQYLYRNSKSAVGNYGAAMQTIVAATLHAMDSKHTYQQIPAMSASTEETLMYSNSKEVDEKRFYRNGDDDFGTDGKGSPFAQVPKVQQAQQALIKLVQNLQDKLKGIDQQAPVQQQRLVEMLRMCTQQELNQVERQCPGNTAQQKEQCKQMFVNGLAECGTKNCVAELAKRIKNKQVSQANAVKALLALTQLPAPSDNILEEMEQLCSSEPVESQPTTKQSCWLTFGALVNEVCQHKTEKNAEECAGETANCVQSGFSKKGQCPMDKKQKYKEAMLAVYQNSGCIYDKMVALSALGNAGMDNSLKELENIIKDPREPRVVRVMAIHATRRLQVNAPWEVQSVLMPVFLNTREQPHVRIAAFANLMNENGQPEPHVVDQLMYTIANEPNKEVQAYAYRTMKSMAKSQKPNEKQIAKHIRSALKMANVDEQQLRSSGKWEFSLFNAEEREGVFVSLAQAVSARSALPAYAHAQLDSHFNDQYQLGNVKVFMLQQEVEKWYGNMANRFIKQQQQSQHTRGQRRSQPNSEKLNDIYKALGIKSRRSFFGTDEDDSSEIGKYQQNVQPFAMLSLRSNNVDKAFIALDEHLMEEQTRRILNGQEKADWALLLGQGKQMNMAIVQNLNEKEAKIPTSVGVQLRILNSMPILANIEGQMKIKAESASLMSPLGIQFDVNALASARLSQIQKMELWTPFASSGVESVRSAQVNLPLQAELNANSDQGISLKANLPKQKTQLASVHSLPITFTAKVDQNTKLVREPRQIVTIHDPKLERQQYELNSVQGQKNLAMPLHFRGHYHWPAEPTSYQQFAQLLLATENAVNIHYQPSRESPREAIFRVTGQHFEQLAQNEQPDAQLRNFFSEKFANAYSCEDEQCQQRGDCEQCEQIEQQQREDAQELEDQQMRQQSLHSFISAYKPRQQYKHSLKMVAQTNGGAKDAKAQGDIQAMCDEQTAYCKVLVKVERPPIGNENQKWMLNAQAHVLMPETAASVEQLQTQPKQLKQFIAQAKAQWGPQGQQTQQVNIRVHGAQAHTQQVRAVLQQQQGNQLISAQHLRNMQRRSAFLNKFQIEAIYSLKANAQNAINRVLELFKSAYFWNTKSQLMSGQSAQKDGKIAATILIDPVTQKRANITIRTPAQQLRMEQIEVPYKVRPFALIRQRSAQQTHSLAQLFHQFSIKYRPQCTVDGRKVNTFDDLIYTAPLSSNCYSVVAKDCGSDQPQFVVLMKKVPQQQQQQQTNKRAQNAAKVLKVITPDQQIECHPKTNAAGIPSQLICKVNGQQVTGDEQCQDSSSCVQFNNKQQDDVTIQTEGIAVRFNGRKAWLKVSQAYKNTQCGLCGHYDDSDDQGEELRMANGQRASDLAEFHRSYALEDAEECSQQAMNNFYSEQQQQNNEQDTFHGQFNQFENEDEADDEQQQQSEKDEWQNEQFNGQFEEQNDGQVTDGGNPFEGIFNDQQQQQKCCCCCDDDEDEEGTNEQSQCRQNCQNGAECPEKCNKNDQKQCRNSSPPQPQQQQNCKGSDDEQCKGICNDGDEACAEQQQQQQWKAVWPILKTKTHEQNHAVCFSTRPVKHCPPDAYPYNPMNGYEQQQPKTKKVSFVCMERAEPETRRLLRLLRRGQRVVDVTARGSSFMENVNEPHQCWRRRY
ncbi:hypothetical protein niasHT_000197 [Heterodera trifolii]|uniref:Vitellogenin n=1 Tax=Heterodera trifolii TaxID=157864 RepID=A0ABD2LVI3_9BILA